MNLKYELRAAKTALYEAQQENRELRESIQRAGIKLLEGKFTRRDGSESRFYLELPEK